MGDLTRNLSRSEFECKCGCGFAAADHELVEVLQEVRDRFEATTGEKKPLIITSGCRCPTHNQAVGGAKKSTHMLGIAADFMLIGVEPSDIYDHLNGAFPDKYGLILYPSWVHLDMRKTAYRGQK